MVCGSRYIELSVAISIPRTLAGAEKTPTPCHDRFIHGKTWRLEEGGSAYGNAQKQLGGLADDKVSEPVRRAADCRPRSLANCCSC